MLENKLIRIFYFSGSRNTLIAAKTLKKNFQEKGYFCSLEKMTNGVALEVKSYSHLALVFSVEVQSNFPLVCSFVRNLPKGNGRKVFMFDIFQSFSSGVVGPLKKILEEKDYKCIGAKEFKMASSIKMVHKDEIKIYRNMKIDVAKYVDQLIQEKSLWISIPVISDIMSFMSKGDNIWKLSSKKTNVDSGSCVK